MSDIKVGDRVRVVHEYRYDTGSYDGAAGVVEQIDAGDEYPYLVALEDAGRSVWMHAVDRIEEAPSDREALVARAKELLKDTPHTGADVIAMAAFLAGE
ncbi:hypothetical protein [Streptomyces sp. NPDC002346]